MGYRTELVARPAQPWPRAAGWLVPGEEYDVPGANCTWLEYLIVRRIRRDYGILEQPWASNRGTRIDAMTRRAGLTPPVWWCAIEIGTVYADCGALVPADYPATNAWRPHVVETPRPASAILYGTKESAHHIGAVTRVGTGMPGRPPHRDLLTAEGNRDYAGSASNNGVAVDEGPLLRLDVLGFIRPEPVPGWTLERYAPADFLLEHLAVLPAAVRAAALPKIAAVIQGAA